MSSKTPEQIAAEFMECFHVRDGDVDECSASYVQGVLEDVAREALEQAPAFKNGYDYYREQWEKIKPESDSDDSFNLQILSSATPLYGDGTSARTHQLSITPDQAEHILAYMSSTEERE